MSAEQKNGSVVFKVVVLEGMVKGKIRDPVLYVDQSSATAGFLGEGT